MRHVVQRVVPLALTLLVSLVSAAPAALVPPFYSAKEITATIVDAATGQPIDGAVVVAVWQLETVSGEGPRLQVSEAVTGADGQFFIPAWGPKPRPPMTEFANKSPYLVVFKSGYVPLRLHNARKSQFAELRSRTDLRASEINYRAALDGDPNDPVQDSVWNGMAIRMDPFRGTPEEWFRGIERILLAISWRDAKYARRFFEALRAEREYFIKYPLDSRIISPQQLNAFFVQVESRINTGSER